MTKSGVYSPSAMQVAMVVIIGLLFFAAANTSAATAAEERQDQDVVVAAVRTAGTPAESYWKTFSDQYESAVQGSVVFADIATVLANSGSIIEALRTGDIQLTVISDSFIYDLIPEFSVLRLPYLIDGENQLKKTFQNCIEPVLAPQFSAAGLVLLDPMRSGWLVIYGSQTVERPEDLTGAPYRQSLNPITNLFLEHLGASLMVVPYPKIHEWLAAESTAYGDFSVLELTSMRRNQPDVKALTMTRHGYFLGAVLANKKWYDSQSSTDRKLLRSALPAEDNWGKVVADYEQVYLEDAKRRGVIIADIPPDNRSLWVDIATEFRDGFLKSRGARWKRLNDCIQGQVHVQESDAVRF